MITLIITTLIVIISSAICSGTEAAMFSISIIKVRQLASQKEAKAEALLKIKTNMGRPIATIVVMNNIANIVGSVMVGTVAANELGNQWVGLFSGVLTFLIIIFSEIIPKTLGERHSDTIALQVSKPLLLLTSVLSPILWMVEKITGMLTGKPKEQLTTNEAEIKSLANIGGQEGVIEKQESELINRVFELNNTTARMIMTPRVSMTYLAGNSALIDIKQEIINSEHSRLVVIGETPDEILGIALKDELLIGLLEGKEDLKVKDFANEPIFVSESSTAEFLLNQFQSCRKHLGIIMDEFGGVTGVVTLEDVLEILTGEIVDETDKTIDLQEKARKT